MTIEIVWPAWLIALPLTLLFCWLMLRAGRRLRLLMDTPTSKAKGVFIGQVELAGRAVIGTPVQSFLAGRECVWTEYAVEEQWARWETETYTDSKGNRKTRQVRKTGWTRVDGGGAKPVFAVEDETGSVQVRPEGAEVEAVRIFDQTVGRGDPLYYGKGPAGAVSDSTGQRHFTEEALVQAGESTGLPKAWPAGALAGLMLTLWLFGWCWMAFNSLVHLRNRAAQAASLIEVQLKRRADLIPRLVAVVAGLRDHERTVQTELAAIRAQSMATPLGQPGPDFAATATAVRVVAERYPELVGDAAFRELQRELADTETRVALSRDYHNEIATHLNTRLEILPDRWLARLAGLRPRQLWQAEGFERGPVAARVDG